MTGIAATDAPHRSDGPPARRRPGRAGAGIAAALAVAVVTAIVLAGCTSSTGTAPQLLSRSESGAASPVVPPSSGSGVGPSDPGTDPAGSGPTDVSSEAGSDTTGPPPAPSQSPSMTLSSTTPAANTTAATTAVLPPQTSITLASSASFTVSVAPSVQVEDPAVIDAYISALEIADSATADPSRDWSIQASRFFAEPYLTQFTDGLRALASANARGVGHIFVEAIVIAIDPKSAKIRSCVDTSHQDIVDASGNSLGADSGDGNSTRYVALVSMKLEGTQWKIASNDNQRSTRC